MASLIFKDAEAAKAAIMASQQKEIAKLYEDWADEIGERAKYYSHKSTASAPVSERYYRELQKQLRQTSQKVSNEIYKKIKSNIYIVADAVVSDNVKWLESFGFSSDGLNAAFSYVPHEIVQNLVTGQIYDSGWSLSSRIWGDNEQTLKDIYQVMAKGLAENKPIYEIAKDLESYVRPSAKLPWNLRMADGKKIYKKQVDYNAQRLARTLVQHGYQQSFIATTQKNPFITEYIWRSNGSRVCELCMSRDGQHYKKDELPMDHPNGMCTMEPAVADDMVDQLADWFNSPDGTYPDIDEFAKNFGYTSLVKADVKDYNTPFNLVTRNGYDEILDDIRDYYLPEATREKLDKIESLRTYSDFEEYFASKGIILDTDLVKLKESMRDKEIEAVKSLCQKIVTGVEAYEDTFGPEALSKLSRIILYDESLDVKAAYHFNMIGENDPFAGTIRFKQWDSDGREVFHELAHAFQDSHAKSNEDAVMFASRMVSEANLSDKIQAYTGAASEVLDAERAADAFSFAYIRGNEEAQKFLSNVRRILR